MFVIRQQYVNSYVKDRSLFEDHNKGYTQDLQEAMCFENSQAALTFIQMQLRNGGLTLNSGLTLQRVVAVETRHTRLELREMV